MGSIMRFCETDCIISDFNNVCYSEGFLFCSHGKECHKIAIPLGSQYKNIGGTVFIPMNIITESDQIFVSDPSSWNINIYRGNSLFKTASVRPAQPYSFNIDIKNTNTISFELICCDVCCAVQYAAIANLTLF